MKRLKKIHIRLQTWLTLLVCVVVLVALSVSGYLIGSRSADNVRAYQAEKAMDVASTISQTKLVIDGLTGASPAEEIQRFTKAVQDDTNVEYIVVMNTEHIRLSHPVTERIGEYFVGNDEDRAFEGERYTSSAHGTLGESMRAFVPVWAEGEIVGVVAVGILLDNIQLTVFESVKTSYIGIGAGLLIGMVGAFLLASRVKRTLFGLEPKEIAQILREREAIFESVREGIVAIDERGEIVVANQAAFHFFQRAGLDGDPIGQKINDFLPASGLKEVLINERLVHDQSQKFRGIDIIVNRVPVISGDKIVGALVTFKDKSELTSLIEQLSGAKAYAEMLRAQTHEFMNKLHVISAMVHTESYEELAAYTTYLSESYQRAGDELFQLVKDPVIAGYLSNKVGEFRNSDVDIELSGEGPVPILKEVQKMDKIITIIGNLCDNAYEAVLDQEEKKIQMTISHMDNQFHFSLQDNGGGLDVKGNETLFTKGISTKGEDRGYGLYLTKQALDDLGGTLQVTSVDGQGTQFSINIPYEGEEQ